MNDRRVNPGLNHDGAMSARTVLLGMALLAAAMCAIGRQPSPAPGNAPMTNIPPLPGKIAIPVEEAKFKAYDIWIDSGQRALGAYQVEVTAPTDVTFIGLEGGEAQGYRDAPYYDPAGLRQNRLIFGGIAQREHAPTAEDKQVIRAVLTTPPAGMNRIARVHTIERGNPGVTGMKIGATITAAGDDKAERIDPLPRVELRPVVEPVKQP